MSEPLWCPDPDRVARANLTAFARQLRETGLTDAADYPSLHRWSVEHPDQFWPAVWRFCEVRASRPWDQVLVDAHDLPMARWFVGARLNFAQNLLRYRDDHEALVFWNEAGRQRARTYRQLYDEVSRMAAALRATGVVAGDRVAGYLPNLPETVIAMLAATSLGAIWSSTSPDFGLQGVVDRFGQIGPKVLVAADGYHYNGKPYDLGPRLVQLAQRLPGLERTVLVPYLHREVQTSGLPGAVGWDDFLSPHPPGELDFVQLPFDHPLYILYSSGTTGMPKCIVHGAGGTLLQHLKEHVLHVDLKRHDRLIYFTTCGWMMWNWLVSGLASGATLLLYDGSPLAPRADWLFDLAQQERVSIFGTSARYLASIQKAGIRPVETHRLEALRTILSTGSPLAAGSFDYVYQHVKRDVQLASISGGTDIVSCFVLGNPWQPVHRGEIQGPGLGMRVEVFDPHGKPLAGGPGELVCTAPFPSMPVGFWNDPHGEKYRRTYFEHYPNVWRHGDWCEWTRHGGMVIHGRSDAVLNPGGVRIGTAEIYRQVEQVPEVLESVVVGQQWDGDVRIVLFVKLRDGLVLDDALRARIVQTIRSNTTPRHVPKKIVQVADIPRTLSGKTVELAVRDVIHGRPVSNREALANPEALELFRGLAELAE